MTEHLSEGPEIISGFGPIRELWASEVGAAAFHGRVKQIEAFIARGIDWERESAKDHSSALHCALYGNKAEVAKLLLEAGAPVSEIAFRIAVWHCPECLALLPADGSLVESLQLERRTWLFDQHLLDGQVSSADELLRKGVDLSKPLRLTSDWEEVLPVHYAARNGSLPVLQLISTSGADLNALTPDGKSPLRLVAENPAISDKQRRKALAFLRSEGARMVPEISSWWERLWIYLGSRAVI